MKIELYKQKIEKYSSTRYKDSTDLFSYKCKIANFSSDHPYFEPEQSYSDQKSFVENFGNPLYDLAKQYSMVVVEKTNDKVSLKCYFGNKIKGVGKPWFSISKNCVFLTVNLKTGNVYQGHILDYQKKRKFTRKIRCNFFLNNPLIEFQQKLKNLSNSLCQSQDTDFYWKPIIEFVNAIDENNNHLLTPNERLFKFYLDKKQIKYPNNFGAYQEFFYGKNFRSLLKKCKNKLVETVMRFYEISGDKVRKALHEASFINVKNYLYAKKLFGEDWVNQDEILIKELLNSAITFDISNYFIDRFNQFATKKEKRNAFKLFKNYHIQMCVDKYTLIDHFRFFVELKGFGETSIVWKSDGENLKQFSDEHLDWSDKLEFYKKGIYHRIHPQIYYEKLQSFELLGENYFPYLLSSSEEYNSESQVQSNCVKGYIGRPNAFIISLRKGEISSEDRITIEYRIYSSTENKKIQVERVQTRGKFNSEPSAVWKQPIEILDKTIFGLSEHINLDLFRLEKICSNGTKLESGIDFDEFGNLKWSYTPIDYHGSLTNFFI